MTWRALHAAVARAARDNVWDHLDPSTANIITDSTYGHLRLATLDKLIEWLTVDRHLDLCHCMLLVHLHCN